MDADALSDCHIGTALPALPPSRGRAPVAIFWRAYEHNGFDGIAICTRTTHKACCGPNSPTAWGTRLIPTPRVTLIEHPEAGAEGQRPLP